MSVTEADVLAIMDTSLTESDLVPFLTAADAIVTANLSASTLSTTVLDLIRTYLAAHLACVKSPFAIRKKMDIAEDTYGYKGGKGLDATPYGETVKMLDSTGVLFANMSGSQMVTIEVIDFPVSDD